MHLLSPYGCYLLVLSTSTRVCSDCLRPIKEVSLQGENKEWNTVERNPLVTKQDSMEGLNTVQACWTNSACISPRLTIKGSPEPLAFLEQTGTIVGRQSFGRRLPKSSPVGNAWMLNLNMSVRVTHTESISYVLSYCYALQVWKIQEISTVSC